MLSSVKLKPLLLSALIIVGDLSQGDKARAEGTETLTLAGGCFWCIESDFEQVPGVRSVLSGYTGGTLANPTYRQVTGGDTGHYEAVQIEYDPDTVTVDQLLSMFFRSVDPTDAGGQFCDRGDSYRTAIFVSDAVERAAATQAKGEAERVLDQKIVTPILAESTFYEAEAYHQDYYKGTNIVLTRFGPKRQSEAYKAYRTACGRDERVRQLWGSAAPFAGP